MAPGTREKVRKVATPKSALKTATSAKASASDSAKPRRAKNATDNNGNEDETSSAKKSRKRAADYFEARDDETSRPSTDKKTEKPQKKVKTSALHKVKPSKDDGHPVETAKSFPGGDMVEMEPEEIEHTKPGKISKAMKTKPSKAGKASSTKKDDTAKSPSKKSLGKKKDDEPSEEAVDMANVDEGTTATKQKSKGSKKVGASNAMDQAPFEKLLSNEANEAPVLADQEPVFEAATAGKKKSGAKARGAKKTIDPTEVTAGPTEGPVKKGGDRSLDKTSASDKPDNKSKSSRKDNISVKKATTNGKTEESLKAEGSKTRKRKAPVDIDADAIKSKLLDPVVEAGSSKKKQKKSQTNIGEKANGTLNSLISSGKETAIQGMAAAKNLLNDIAGGAEDSVMGDITRTASDIVDTKDNEKKKLGKRAKNGKAKDDVLARADDGFEGFDKEEESALMKAQLEDGEEDDQTAALLKEFEGDEEDDDEPPNDMGFETGQELPGLPDKRGLAGKLKKAKGNEETGVVYIGRIPHGFHEHEMRSYFTQFGTVNHVRLSRSKKTGNSKHYAFLEFASAEVAKIVADTMNNYLMFGHILKCKLVPKEQVHQSLWKGADRRFKKVPWNKIEGRKLEVPVGRDVWERRVETEIKRREKKAEQTKAIGYEFEGTGLKAVHDLPVKETKEIEPSDQVVEQEQTLVVDAGDRSMVIVSEEIKTKKPKNGKKGKDANKETEGLVEIVRTVVGKAAGKVGESLSAASGLTEDATTTAKETVDFTLAKTAEATSEITKGAKKTGKRIKGRATAATEKTTTFANDTIEQAKESDITSEAAEKSAHGKDLATSAVEDAMRAVKDAVSSATDTAKKLQQKDLSIQSVDTLHKAKDASRPAAEKASDNAQAFSGVAESLISSTNKATKKGKAKATATLENAKEASGSVAETASGAAEKISELANSSAAAAKTTVKNDKAKATLALENTKGAAGAIAEKTGKAAKKGAKVATTNKNDEQVGVVEKASEIATVVAGKANEAASGVAEKASEMASEVAQKATDAKDAASDLADGALNTAKDAAGAVADSVSSGARDLAHQAGSAATTGTQQAGLAVKGAKKGAKKAADSATELADAATEVAKDSAKRIKPIVTAVVETADSALEGGKKMAKNAKDSTKQLSKDAAENLSNAADGVVENANPIVAAISEQVGSALESMKATASTATDVIPAVGQTIATTAEDAVTIAQGVGTDVVKKVSGKGRKRKSEAAEISEDTMDTIEHGTTTMTEMTGVTEKVTTEVIEELTIQETEDTEKITKKTKRFSKKEIKPTTIEEIGEGSSDRKAKRSRKST